MALVLVKTSITSDCETQVWTDTTTYNSGGIPARSLLYVKFILSLRTSTGRENITVAAYNENTAATWSVTVSEDGWYEGYLFACKIYSAAISYAINNITYDAATDLFYKSLVNSNLGNAVTDTTKWLATDDVEDFAVAVALPQTDTFEITENIIELCRSRKCEGQMLLKAGCGCNDDCKISEYEKVRMKMEAVAWNEANSDFSAAQEIVENLNDICIDLEDCGSGCSGCS